jgi:hypothetical protein
VPFFLGRWAVYAVSWFGLAVIILFRPAWTRAVAPPGLILLALTYTFAAIDLTMSVDPKFNSNIFGMIALTEAGITALCAAVVLGLAAAPPPAVKQVGQLLLGTAILWVYLDFMQLLIVWESDIASDGPWYAVRSHGAWAAIGVAVTVLHFVLPFLLLIATRVQRSPRALAAVAAVILVSQVGRVWWLVLPSAGRLPSWVDAGCILAFAGFGAALALAVRNRRVAVPAHA